MSREKKKNTIPPEVTAAEVEKEAEVVTESEPAVENSPAPADFFAVETEAEIVELDAAEVYETTEDILGEAKGGASANARSSAAEIGRICGPLLVICMAVALVVSFVYSITADRIAEAALREQNAAIARIFGETAVIKEVDPLADTTALYAIGGGAEGYCVRLNTEGFGGTISMMVGVNPDGTLRGVEIVSHSETPGFGANADDPDYLGQYSGHGIELTLNKEISAVSGATVSSRAILDGVNMATAALVEAGLVPAYRTPEPEPEPDDWDWDEWDDEDWEDEFWYEDGGEAE